MHRPLQQLPADEQISPSTSQPGPAGSQTPALQLFEQQAASVAHESPASVHVVVSLHVPPTQPVEQQSAAVVHTTPATLHPPATWHRWTPSTVSAHRPEQQSPGPVHASNVRMHEPDGSVQTPEAHVPLQQFASTEHAPPTGARPPSTEPSQSLSIPSHVSAAPGCTAGSRSLQSLPMPRQPASLYPSPSRSHATCVQLAVAFEQPSIVHAMPSSQLGATPPVQTPGVSSGELHRSTPLQKKPSLHTAAVDAVHATPGVQPTTVHTRPGPHIAES